MDLIFGKVKIVQQPEKQIQSKCLLGKMFKNKEIKSKFTIINIVLKKTQLSLLKINNNSLISSNI